MIKGEFFTELEAVKASSDEGLWHRRLFIRFFRRERDAAELLSRISSLVKTGNPAAGVILRSLLYHQEPPLAVAAARGLSELGGKLNLVALAGTCTSQKPIAAEAIRLLEQHPSPHHAAALRDAAVGQTDPEVQAAAVSSLGAYLKHPEAAEPARRILESLIHTAGPAADLAQHFLERSGGDPGSSNPLASAQARALSAIPTLSVVELSPVAQTPLPEYPDEEIVEDELIAEEAFERGGDAWATEASSMDQSTQDRETRFGELVTRAQELSSSDLPGAYALFLQARELYPSDRIENLEAWIEYVESRMEERKARFSTLIREARAKAKALPRESLNLLIQARDMDPGGCPPKILSWIEQLESHLSRNQFQQSQRKVMQDTVSLEDQADPAPRPARALDPRQIRDTIARLQRDTELPRGLRNSLDRVRDVLESASPRFAVADAYGRNAPILREMIDQAILERGVMSLDALRDLALGDSSDGRAVGIIGLAYLAEPGASSFLARAARTTNPQISRMALERLTRREDAVALATMKDILSTGGPLRLRLLEVMATDRKPLFQQAVVPLLGSEDPATVALAADCLAGPLESSVVSLLVESARWGEPDSIELLVRALGRSGNAQARAQLQELATRPETEEMALDALGQLAGQEFAYQVLDWVTESGPTPGRLRFLGRFGGPDAGRWLSEKLSASQLKDELVPTAKWSLRELMARGVMELPWAELRPGTEGDDALQVVLEFRAGRIDGVDLARGLDEGGAALEPTSLNDPFVEVRAAMEGLSTDQKGEAIRSAVLGGCGRALIHLLRTVRPDESVLLGLVEDLARWSGEAFGASGDLLDQVDLAIALVLQSLDCQNSSPYLTIFSRRRSVGYRQAVAVAIRALARLGFSPSEAEIAEVLMTMDTDLAGPLFLALAAGSHPGELRHLVDVLKSPRTQEDPDREMLYGWTVDLLWVWGLKARLSGQNSGDF